MQNVQIHGKYGDINIIFFTDEVVTSHGPIEADKENIRQEPYSLPQGFMWDTLDLSNADVVSSVSDTKLLCYFIDSVHMTSVAIWGEGSLLCLLSLSVFSPLKFSFAIVKFPEQRISHKCTDCKDLWGKFVILVYSKQIDFVVK